MSDENQIDTVIDIYCDLHGCMPTVICGNYKQLASIAHLAGFIPLQGGNQYFTVLGNLGLEMDCAAKELYVK